MPSSYIYLDEPSDLTEYERRAAEYEQHLTEYERHRGLQRLCGRAKQLGAQCEAHRTAWLKVSFVKERETKPAT